MIDGRRSRRVRQVAAVAGLTGAVVLLTLMMLGPLAPPEPSPDIGQPPEKQEPGGPSQSEVEAARDEVLPEIAEVPFDVRVNLASPTFAAGTTRILTEEGVWMMSRPDAEGYDGDPLLGDPQGIYGRDFVQLSMYSEILLLDASESRILRAFPMTPAAPPGGIALNQDAVYCHRPADGGEPDSMLCRIDRSTHGWLVRIFPTGSQSSVAFLPENWVVNEPVDGSLDGVLRVSEDEVQLVSEERVITFDPRTLELLRIDEP